MEKPAIANSYKRGFDSNMVDYQRGSNPRTYAQLETAKKMRHTSYDCIINIYIYINRCTIVYIYIHIVYDFFEYLFYSFFEDSI